MIMNTKLVGGLILLALLIGGGAWFFLNSQSKAPSNTQDDLGEAAVTIVRTNDGYEPKEVTINKGDVVRFVNESDEYHWPASDLHPTHALYSEFDPLRPIAPGEEWKFRFDQTGEWRYHDHIRANKVGKIIVN
jgi:plastocyanin